MTTAKSPSLSSGKGVGGLRGGMLQAFWLRWGQEICPPPWVWANAETRMINVQMWSQKTWLREVIFETRTTPQIHTCVIVSMTTTLVILKMFYYSNLSLIWTLLHISVTVTFTTFCTNSCTLLWIHYYAFVSCFVLGSQKDLQNKKVPRVRF